MRKRLSPIELGAFPSPGHPEFKPGPAFEAEVWHLIKCAGEGSPKPFLAIGRLLEVVGCVTNLSRATYEYGMLYAAFHENRSDTDLIIKEGLAAASDASGFAGMPCNEKLTIMLYALSKFDNWRTILEPGHDPHAFARNLLVYFGNKDYSFNTEWALSMASTWLRPKKEPFAFVRYPSDEDLKNRVQEVATAMFGEHWWTFNGPEGGEPFDPKKIFESRPQFLRGLVPRLETADVSLPAMWL